MIRFKSETVKPCLTTIPRRLSTLRLCVVIVAWLAMTSALSAGDGHDGGTKAKHTGRGLYDIDIPADNGRVKVKRGLVDFGKQPETSAAWIFRSREIIMTPVMDQAGEEIGHIEELVVDVRNGNVRYAAVGLPTLLGREKLLAIPWGSFALHRDKTGHLHFVLDVPTERLRNAPGFDRSHWPNVGNRKWAEQIAIYYGVVIKEGDLKSNFGTDTKKLSQIPYLMRSQQIVDIPMNDAGGQTIGRVLEALVDLEAGSMRYVACKFDRLNDRQKLLPLPLHVLSFDEKPAPPHFTLLADVKRLENAPAIDKGEMTNIREAKWSEKIDEYYQASSDPK